MKIIKNVIIVLFIGIALLIAYEIGVNNTTVKFEKIVNDKDVEIEILEGMYDDMCYENDNLVASKTKLDSELTAMYEGDAYEISWNHNGKIYHIRDNGKIFGQERWTIS